MFETIRNAFKIKEVRRKILFTILFVLIYRLGCVITVPGLRAIEFDNTQGPWNIVPSVYLMTTADGTYCLHCASDVQYDPRDEEATENYVSMYQEISQIRLVLDKAMAE